MAKLKKVPKKKVNVDRFALIEVALRKKTKPDLIALLTTMARQHDEACRELEAKLSIDKPVDLLLADVLRPLITRRTLMSECTTITSMLTGRPTKMSNRVW